MDVMFRRFAVTDDEKNGETLRYEVLTNVGGRARIITEDYCYIVEQFDRLSSLAHGIILRNTFARIRSHLLFHAAALSCGGKGVIVAADSYCGKTTLTLALVRHGFKFLSDDVAALGLNNGQLTPYPRCLIVRGGRCGFFSNGAGSCRPIRRLLSKARRERRFIYHPHYWATSVNPIV